MASMPPPHPAANRPTALIVGASRGLGHAIAAELFDREWNVIGTVRNPASRTPLHDLADRSEGGVLIERLDINDAPQLTDLRARLAQRRLDVLFVNAGTAKDERVPIGAVSTDDFVEVMVTNALSPMRVIEALEDLVAADGLIGAMSSGQGSITNNTNGSRELYRGSKAALNMFMRSFAARQSDTQRAILLMAPGWIRTELGGAEAPYTIEESVPLIIDVLLSKRQRPGIEYLDRFGKAVPW
jgi:NAD(P)-dependent dehydrogenase (short-subunit alcohol dehydrogenase family)